MAILQCKLHKLPRDLPVPIKPRGSLDLAYENANSDGIKDYSILTRGIRHGYRAYQPTSSFGKILDQYYM